MQPSIGQVSIRCLEAEVKYLLQFEGSDVSETLPSIEEAVRRAGELVVEETRFTIYDQEGNGLVMGTLFPHEFKKTRD
jgi:hypothetical protein